MRPFDCDHVERFFDDADFGAVPLQVAANDALLRFAEVGAGFTENNFVLDAEDGRGKLFGFFLRHTNQVIREALRDFRADPGQPVKRLDQAGYRRGGGRCDFRRGHQGPF